MRRGESLCARAAARRSLLLLLLTRAVAQDVDLTRDFFFGLGTAPGHAEDSLDDAWRQFAEDGHVQAWKRRGQPDERLQFWSRPEVELDLAAETGIKVYRLGVDWGRLVPNCSMSATDACGVQDVSALQRYRDIVGMVRARNMSCMISLFHHSFPKWGMTPPHPGPEGAAAGDMWGDENAIRHFVAFASDVVDTLADLVDMWVPMNEPHVFAMLTYCQGVWPPGPEIEADIARTNCFVNPHVGALKAEANMAAAHRQVYHLIHAKDSLTKRALVGTAHLASYSQASNALKGARPPQRAAPHRPPCPAAPPITPHMTFVTLPADADSFPTAAYNMYSKFLFIDRIKDSTQSGPRAQFERLKRISNKHAYRTCSTFAESTIMAESL